MVLYLSLCIGGLVLFALSLLHDDVDIGHAMDLGDHAPSWLSLRAVLLFCIGFGAAGTIAMRYGFSSVPASVFGLLAGVGLSLIGLKFVALLATQESDSTTRVAKLVGREGVITIPIENNGVGQVVVQDEHGSSSYMPARGRGPRVVGEHVKVIACVGHEVVVD